MTIQVDITEYLPQIFAQIAKDCSMTGYGKLYEVVSDNECWDCNGSCTPHTTLPIRKYVIDGMTVTGQQTAVLESSADSSSCDSDDCDDGFVVLDLSGLKIYGLIATSYGHCGARCPIIDGWTFEETYITLGTGGSVETNPVSGQKRMIAPASNYKPMVILFKRTYGGASRYTYLGSGYKHPDALTSVCYAAGLFDGVYVKCNPDESGECTLNGGVSYNIELK